MRNAIPILLFSSLLAAAAPQAAGSDNSISSPQTETVEPRVAKPGTVITVKGISLSSDRVEEVFLTDHRFDMKVKVLKQENSLIEFRVPPFAKPGRLQLLLLTGPPKPAYLEQPFFIQILDKDEELPASAPAPRAAPLTPPVQVTSAAPPPPETPKKPQPVEVASTSPRIPVAVTPQPVKKELPPPVAPAPAQADPPAATPDITPVANRAIVPAKVVKRTPIVMPANQSGGNTFGSTVELLAVIGANGKVKEVKIIKGNPFVAQTAASSIRQWVYEPARVNGHAVESEVPVILNLRGAGK